MVALWLCVGVAIGLPIGAAMFAWSSTRACADGPQASEASLARIQFVPRACADEPRGTDIAHRVNSSRSRAWPDELLIGRCHAARARMDQSMAA